MQRISIRQLAQESYEETGDEDNHDLNDDLIEIAMESMARHNLAMSEVSTAASQASLEDRGIMRKIAGIYADEFKMLFSWYDANGKAIKSLRQDIRDARHAVQSSKKDQFGTMSTSLVRYIGDVGAKASTTQEILKVLRADSELTKSVLSKALDVAGKFTHDMSAHVIEKDNDWKFGYDEVVDGIIDIIDRYSSGLTSMATNSKVGDGYDANDLKVEDGSNFSDLMAGNYAISSSWQYAIDNASAHPSSAEKIEHYCKTAMHDFVSVPKKKSMGSWIPSSKPCTEAELVELLKIADMYLDSADIASNAIKLNALPIFKARFMSNMFSGVLGLIVKATFSKNYRAIHLLVNLIGTWAAKMQRKAATRNQRMAKEIIRFVRAAAR